jgi:large subunit ribosomal protein L20
MARVKRGFVARRRRKKVLNRAKGFRGSLHKLFRPAKQAVMKALKYATVHRRLRKRDMRALWITRIGSSARALGMSYNAFISGIKRAGVGLDRKALAELAVSDHGAFKALADLAKSSEKKTAK